MTANSHLRIMNQLSDHRPRVPGSSSVREAMRCGESDEEVGNDGGQQDKSSARCLQRRGEGGNSHISV
ncbi:hypothetical protein E2C01_011859 [Portunus trituberculatus]|uniref:Uncharacterized protein n=1 Tax=Portunus trituberculatus TaxID=210409 RepID=A0A5B7DCK6_PORTR|nr:hypothetical protein [Portunus trituberculatus]